jgi:hypothetical protein
LFPILILLLNVLKDRLGLDEFGVVIRHAFLFELLVFLQDVSKT